MWKFLVGRQKDLERGAFLDLSRERAGCAEHEFDSLTTIASELTRDVSKREIQVRCGGNRWGALRVRRLGERLRCEKGEGAECARTSKHVGRAVIHDRSFHESYQTASSNRL